MTIENFYSMLIQVVSDMGYEKGLQINTIFITDKMPDIRQDSLGALYTDYLENRFWSRTWVNTGAKRSQGPKAEWPILIIQPGNIETDCLDSWDSLYLFDFLLIDQVGCDNCPNAKERTPNKVKANALAMLRMFFFELYTYSLVELDRTPDDNTFEWLSAGRLEHITSGPGVPDFLTTHEAITAFIQDEPIIYREWGNTDDIKGYFTTLRIHNCEPITGNFIYNKPVIKSLATTVCDSC